YCLAYRAAALSTLEASVRNRYLGRLRDDVRLLALAGAQGNYSYDCAVQARPVRVWDNSNSQYGVLGMAFADQAGIAAPRNYWMTVMKHWQACQNEDGGWSYQGGGIARGWHPPSTDTMTAAGLASLYAAINATAATPDAAKRAAAACIPIRKDLAWMDRHFPRDRDALSNNQAYYLYVVSRVGLASEKQTFGKTNWASWG
ncbi:MAG: hypothetical protein NT031_19555, partial [Planctomycetota bacterium]|nr:hypothetical protein [Planctomycetota bacterium]